MNRKLFISLLTVTMTFSGAAFAADEPDIPAVIAQRPEYNNSLKANVTVSEIGENYIVAKTEDGMDVQFNTYDKTVFIDSETAASFALGDIKEGDKLYIQYSSVMTKSLPPQTSAEFVAKNCEKGGGVNLIKADTVEKKEDGSLVVTSDGDDLILTISKDARIMPYKTKNIVKADGITPGSTIVAWYDIVTMSLPAQAHTDKVVLAEVGAEEETDGAYKLVVGTDKKEVDISDLPSEPYYEGENLMVPLRKISEALGYTVGWNGETGEISVDDNYIQSAVLKEDSAKVTFSGRLRAIDTSREIENAVKTVVKDGCTYVPLDFFKEFLNDVSVNGKTVSVSPSTAEIQD